MGRNGVMLLQIGVFHNENTLINDVLPYFSEPISWLGRPEYAAYNIEIYI